GLFKAMMAKKKQQAPGGGTAMGPGGVLTSFSGGMNTLVRRAAEALGDAVQTSTPVTAIARTDNGFAVTTAAGETLNAESVIVAAPVYAAAAMVQALDTDLAGALREIPFASMTVVCTAYDREDVGHDLHGFGFLV